MRNLKLNLWSLSFFFPGAFFFIIIIWHNWSLKQSRQLFPLLKFKKQLIIIFNIIGIQQKVFQIMQNLHPLSYFKQFTKTKKLWKTSRKSITSRTFKNDFKTYIKLYFQTGFLTMNYNEYDFSLWSKHQLNQLMVDAKFPTIMALQSCINDYR